MERGTVKIVHLEDDPLDRELVAAMLATEGIECEFAYAQREEEFEACLREDVPDLIISDVALPSYDGFRALELARQIHPTVPFILFSGTLDSETAVESLKNGATDYVLKRRPERLPVAVRRAIAEVDARMQRQKMEMELRQRDELLRLIVENVEDLVTVLDSEGRRVFSSPSHRRLLETQSPPEGTDFLLEVHEDDRERVRQAFQATLATGEGQRVEYNLRLADGTVRFVEAHGSLMHKQQGTAGRVLWVSRDETARRQSEERLQQQATLLDEARDAICLTDLDQKILFWNKSAERLYGWSVMEALGKNANELLLLSDVALSAFKMLIHAGEWLGELEQTTRAGRKLVVESRWSLLRDSAGKPLSILQINTDITEKKQIEAQYLRAQRMESIGMLAGGIAHDLNNVLAPIMMATEILLTQSPSPEDRHLLEIMMTSTERGSDLVRQVLSFARGSAGEKRPFQLKHLVAELQKMTSPTFPRSIEVSSSIAPDLPDIQGDAGQIHQVLLNLCVNARDAMPEGGRLRIEAKPVRIERKQTPMQPKELTGIFVELTVSDTGTGIPPAVLPKIFEPFFTTKESNRGTGLGLATVMGIVKGHGGWVDVSSEIGRGTTFAIYLPVPEKTAEFTEASVATPPEMGQGELLLIVDDEWAILEMMRAALVASDYRVIVANSGAEAVATVASRRGEIDLVVTDVMMPTFDGRALVSALRQLDPSLKVIAMTGELSGGDPIDIVEAQLRKPFTTDALMAAIRAALDSE